jgi:hypothetical protein
MTNGSAAREGLRGDEHKRWRGKVESFDLWPDCSTGCDQTVTQGCTEQTSRPLTCVVPTGFEPVSPP